MDVITTAKDADSTHFELDCTIPKETRGPVHTSVNPKVVGCRYLTVIRKRKMESNVF